MSSLILFLFLGLQDPTPNYFTLTASDCSISGPVEGQKITVHTGDLWTATCTVDGNELQIASIDISKKPIGSSSFQYALVNGVGVALSESGNVRYIFDFQKKQFYHGQVNVLLDKGIVMTKTCTGTIQF